MKKTHLFQTEPVCQLLTVKTAASEQSTLIKLSDEKQKHTKIHLFQTKPVCPLLTVKTVASEQSILSFQMKKNPFLSN